MAEPSDYEALYHEERSRRLAESLAAHRELVAEQFRSRDIALDLQAEANRVHFVALNNEAGRIADAAEKSVSREVYDANREADRHAVALALETAKQLRDEDTGSRRGVETVRLWMVVLIAAGALLSGALGALGALLAQP